MKHHFKFATLILLASLIALAACAEKRVYGVPQSQWEQMDGQQRAKLSETYLKEKRLRSQPPVFGVPAAQWEELTEQQRNAAIKSYQENQRIAEAKRAEQAAKQHEIDIIRTQQEPQTKLIDAVSSIMTDSTSYHHRHKHKHAKQHDNSIRVSISGGTVDFDNIDGHSKFNAVSFSIKDDESKQVELIKKGDNFFTSSVNVSVKYIDGNFHLDTEADHFGFHEDPSKHFIFEKSWYDEETYANVNTKGKAHFKNVLVKIMTI